MLVIPIEKQVEFINKFAQERPAYEYFASLLESILKKAAALYAPMSIVQARAKTVLSFSDKIIRKDKYKNPMMEMTDLCGARIISHFESQVNSICHFIEENFTVDKDNSVDVKSRLKVGEFGYRSLHYIVSPGKNEILGNQVV